MLISKRLARYHEERKNVSSLASWRLNLKPMHKRRHASKHVTLLVYDDRQQWIYVQQQNTVEQSTA